MEKSGELCIRRKRNRLSSPSGRPIVPVPSGYRHLEFISIVDVFQDRHRKCDESTPGMLSRKFLAGQFVNLCYSSANIKVFRNFDECTIGGGRDWERNGCKTIKMLTFSMSFITLTQISATSSPRSGVKVLTISQFLLGTNLAE